MIDSSKIFYGVLLLGALLTLGWGLQGAGAQGAAFGLFTVLTLGGSLVCIWERSVVRSAFALMATFTGVAGFFLLLGADFIAMAQILIYVGGILALLLFGVMLSPPDMAERKLSRVLPGLGLMVGATLWVGSKVSEGAVWAATSAGPPDPITRTSRAKEIGIGFLRPDQYMVAFELAAVVLTVALVAAVYIARRRAIDLLPESEGGA